MEDKIIDILLSKAKEVANRNDCCKHSNFTVGAALLTDNNKVYTGFNIENDGIQSICAERATTCSALINDDKNFKAIAIVGKGINDNAFKKTLPCGYCRQFLSEYMNKDFLIYTCDDITNEVFHYTLGELLPESFALKGDE